MRLCLKIVILMLLLSVVLSVRLSSLVFLVVCLKWFVVICFWLLRMIVLSLF